MTPLAGYSPKGSVTIHVCGSDAVCGDAVGLEARWILDMIAEDERRRRDREGAPASCLLAERSGYGCVLCGDEDVSTEDEECQQCRGVTGHTASFTGYSTAYAAGW